MPTETLDQSGEWQETSGEIQWVASEDKGTDNQNKKKDEDEEELDLNKGEEPTHAPNEAQAHVAFFVVRKNTGNIFSEGQFQFDL